MKQKIEKEIREAELYCAKVIEFEEEELNSQYKPIFQEFQNQLDKFREKYDSYFVPKLMEAEESKSPLLFDEEITDCLNKTKKVQQAEMVK